MSESGRESSFVNLKETPRKASVKPAPTIKLTDANAQKKPDKKKGCGC